MPAPLLLAGSLLAGGKIFGGLRQNRMASQLKPSNYIPPALKKNQAELEMMSGATKYPGQSQDEERIKQGTSETISRMSKAAGSASELLNTASAAQSNENRAFRDVSQRALLWKDAIRNNLRNTRGQIANIQQQNRQQYLAAKSALRGAANQNIFGGVSDLVTGLGLAAGQTSAPTTSTSYDFNPQLLTNRWSGLSKYLTR